MSMADYRLPSIFLSSQVVKISNQIKEGKTG